MLSELSSLCQACRAVLFDKLDTGKMHGLDTSNVSSRVVSRCDEPSGIWAIVVRALESKLTGDGFIQFLPTAL